MEYAIIFLPLIGCIIGYLGRSLTKFFSEITTSIFVSLSSILSIIIFWQGIQNSKYGNYIIFEWVSSGNFIANWSINVDPLSSANTFLDHLSSTNLASICNFNTTL